MKAILYILLTLMVCSCKQPKPEATEKPDYSDYYMYNLEDTIYNEDHTIMMYRTDSLLIWERI